MDEKIDPYFERTSKYYSMINSIQNAALEVLNMGNACYVPNMEDLFRNRDCITEIFYFALIKQGIELKEKK